MEVRFSEIEMLNDRIGNEYMSIDGRRLFRIIWSESAFENRHGTFREFTESGLFIREVTETRRVRKYNYIHNRWIFEAWAPGNLTANRELPDATNGDYVPVYVFENKRGEYLPPNEKVVRFLIAAVYGKVKRDEVPSQAYLEEREIQQQVESMDDHPSWFQTRPGEARNAIWYPGIVPEQYRRATFSENLERPQKLPETARQKADVFRDELMEIEALEAQKRSLARDAANDLTVAGPDPNIGSPMHKR